MLSMGEVSVALVYVGLCGLEMGERERSSGEGDSTLCQGAGREGSSYICV